MQAHSWDVRVVGLVVVFLLSVALVGPAAGDVHTWTGSAGGSWTTAGNWSPSGPPAASDHAVIQSGSPVATLRVTTNGSITFDGSAAIGTFVDVYVGSWGHGRLDVINGADLTCSAGILVGEQAGSSGAAAVSGPGSTWTSSTYLYVGYHGSGELTITDGGAVANTFADVGTWAGSSSAATVSGAGSTWTNSGNLFVGYYGSGELTITDGGAVSNTDARVGFDADSSGTVTVSGPGSTWTNSSFLYVGQKGPGELTIQFGGAVSNTNGVVGFAPGSSGTVTVSGSGSTWTNSGYLYVGRDDRGTLTIRDGGAVSNTHGDVGHAPGSSGAVTVSGSGSTWTNSSSLAVGDAGTGGLTISNGGAVSNTEGYVGLVGGSLGAVTVSGAGSTWTNSSHLYVGLEGPGELTIQGGGAVSNTEGYIAFVGGSSGAVTVSGAGSTWTNSGDLYVGRDGHGTLTIEDGAAVSTPGMLYVANGPGSHGTLNLTGGSLTANGIALGSGTFAFNWTGGSLNFTSGVTFAPTGLLGTNISLGPGKGLSSTGDIILNSGVNLNVAGGTFSANALDVYGTARLRSGTVSLGQTFTVRNGGDLEIKGQDLILTTSPTLENNSELTLENATLSAPGMTVVPGATVNFDSGTLSLDGTLTNQDVIRMGAAGMATIRAASLDNASTGAVLGKGTIDAAVTNAGNIGLSGDSSFSEDVTNNSGGKIIVSGGADVTFYEDVDNQAGAEIRVSQGCTATYFGALTGTGAFTGTGTSYIEGDMRPGASAGTMHFEGDVVLGWAAVLDAELAGAGSGQYDVLRVDGSLYLGGTLDIVFHGGFEPTGGETFDILDWGSLTGTFDNESLPGLAAGLDWDTSDLYTTGEISVVGASIVVPEPAGLALLGLGGLALRLRSGRALRKKRRQAHGR